MEDFSYLVSRDRATGKSTIEVEGPGADALVRAVEALVVDIMGGNVATGREIIDFLTTFNGGQSKVEHDEKLQDSTGGWLLKLDEVYSLVAFGTITAGDVTRPLGEALLDWRRRGRDEDPRRASPRYPHTYAADLVRMCGPVDESVDGRARGLKLSRGDATGLVKNLAPALRVAHHELAEMLADYYLANEDAVVDANMERIRVGT